MLQFSDGKSSYLENGVIIPLPSGNARVTEKRGEVFAKGTWKFAPDWILETGARFEFSKISETGLTAQSRSFFYPKPRAVLTWNINPKNQIRLRYERVVGQLDFGNFIATSNLGGTGLSAGNPDLKPDQRDQFEASYEWHFWDKGAIVASYLHEQIKDVSDQIPIYTKTGAFDAPGNIGNGRNDEIHLEMTLPTAGPDKRIAENHKRIPLQPCHRPRHRPQPRHLVPASARNSSHADPGHRQSEIHLGRDL